MSTPDPQDPHRPSDEPGQAAPSPYDQWARGEQVPGSENAPSSGGPAPYPATPSGTPSYGQPQPPYGQAQDPYGQAQDPYAQTPYGQSPTADGQAPTPYGQSQDPYAQAPYGQSQAPYPHQPGTPQPGAFPPPAAYPAPGGYPQSGLPSGGYYPPVASYPKNSLAIWSLVLGIISVVGFWALCPFLAAIGAVVTGHQARGAVGRGQANNGTMAIWGLVLGYVGLGLSAVYFIITFTQGFVDGWNGV